jgi:ethanolamine utilization protein EutQ
MAKGGATLKKLICADDVKAAAEKGQKVLSVECNTIITPAAKDLARELGVEIATDKSTTGNSLCNKEKTIDREKIYQIVKTVLANSILAGINGPSSDPLFVTDCEPKSGLKIVRGRTVKYQPYDTGGPSTNVAYREVVSKNDSPISAGFLTIEKSSFGRELCQEEIDIILEGSLSITINGETYDACQGDVIFVPKGSKATWSSSGYVKLFYATYPINCPELMAQ